MVIPSLLVVVDNSSTKASGWVDSSSSNGDGSQMHHEHSESNWKWSQNLVRKQNSQTKKTFRQYHNLHNKDPLETTTNPKKRFKLNQELHRRT